MSDPRTRTRLYCNGCINLRVPNGPAAEVRFKSRMRSGCSAEPRRVRDPPSLWIRHCEQVDSDTTNACFFSFQSTEKTRDTCIHCLIEYLGENQEELFQDCQEDELEGHTNEIKKLVVIHNPAVEEDPADVCVVIEGIKVLNGCGNRTTACILLMGLIYALNLEYPKKLKYTFEVFQNLFLKLDGAKLLKKVQSLKRKLME
ncbi:uncharacterized protein [Chanodichthys erythropterus]|uniref:uncharacterized protein n=1 Tax=Chanodichthys erythropterus TaxID=933992 RepID=UPI00351E723D